MIENKDEDYDSAVLACFAGGEMRSMFVVARLYKKTTKDVCDRYDEIKKDEEYYNHLKGND